MFFKTIYFIHFRIITIYFINVFLNTSKFKVSFSDFFVKRKENRDIENENGILHRLIHLNIQSHHCILHRLINFTSSATI